MMKITIFIPMMIAFPLHSCTKTIKNEKVTIIKDTNTVYNSTTQYLKSRNIPDYIFEMDSLKILSIQGMDCDYGDTTNCWMIHKISSKIGNLTNLESLALPVNSLRELPLEMRKLQKLKMVNLSDNPGLSNIDVLVQIPSMEILNLFGCSLTKLPDNIGNLADLKELGLTGNSLSDAEIARIKKALPNCTIYYENN
ncbi:MAG: hypothetical protein KG003_03990 [Bacteroidetes bacterium]|nr:hypothetical protein [Bacteroidota bacterium]